MLVVSLSLPAARAFFFLAPSRSSSWNNFRHPPLQQHPQQAHFTPAAASSTHTHTQSPTSAIRLWATPTDESDGGDATPIPPPPPADPVGLSVVRQGGGGNNASNNKNKDEQEALKREKKAMAENMRQAEAAQKMMAAGASAAQLSAYTGIKLVQLETGFQPTLQVTPSHLFVDRDEEGALKQARFVYVDEYTCIGCTNCAMVAPNTFYMDDEHGRARAFQQWKDRPRTIQTAIETCPVDCIHYIPYDELERLEQERDSMKINYKARLVGSDGLLSASGSDMGMQEISGNKDFRCVNCPSRGCFNCPMFGVGENPEYKRKQSQIAAKREKRQNRKDGGASGTGMKRVDL